MATPRRQVIVPPGVPVPYPGFSPAVRFGRWLFVAAQLASDFRSGLAPEVRGNPAMPLAGEDTHIRESRYIFDMLARTLGAAGARFDDGVRIDQFPRTRGVMDPYHVVRKERLSAPRPASTSVLVDGLLVPDARIGVELVVVLPDGEFQKRGVDTDQVPQTLFGIAPAIRAGDFVFVAAQVATDFKSGLAPEARRHPAFWQGSDIELQTRYMLRNFEMVLAAAGSSLPNVVKAMVYLTDITDIPRFDRVWREAFPTDPPARTIVPCPGLGVSDTRVEINLIAVTDAGATRKTVITSPDGQGPLFHESWAVRAGDLLFLSGLVAADQEGLVPAARVNPHHPYVAGGAHVQTEYILERAELICRAAGTRLANAVRMLTIHSDLNEWSQSARVWRRHFPDGDPATTSIRMPAPLAVPGATVLLDLWVGVGD
jgi:enamine deaminase RidA (YjgF/YER057c/UK114 family)